MGIGGESTQLLEAALELGRPIDFFLQNKDLTSEIGDRMDRAFQKAFMSGMFKVTPQKNKFLLLQISRSLVRVAN